jgi:thiamine biosynthesis lipoprotein
LTPLSRREVRRARPFLGTFVDVACDGSLNDVVAAFRVIEKVHRLMSFHDPGSDVSRINREAFRRTVIVHPWTWRVLQVALDFSRESEGVFDITAAQLGDGDWRDIVLEENCAVRFRRRVMVDLGGIAKGFAVDRAVEKLQKNKVATGTVNAGGDIRVFGSIARTIHLRNPMSPARFLGVLRLRDRAIATSATYFAPGALIDGQTRRTMTDQVSVTVAARDCMTADALTKIVFALREKAASLLARHRADALLLERGTSPPWVFPPPSPTGRCTRLRRVERLRRRSSPCHTRHQN